MAATTVRSFREAGRPRRRDARPGHPPARAARGRGATVEETASGMGIPARDSWPTGVGWPVMASYAPNVRPECPDDWFVGKSFGMRVGKIS
jgi:hypothetical protein